MWGGVIPVLVAISAILAAIGAGMFSFGGNALAAGVSVLAVGVLLYSLKIASTAIGRGAMKAEFVDLCGDGNAGAFL